MNPKATVTYADWVDLGCEVVKAEAAKAPGRPIVLYGLSAGGMLAYHVAARVPTLVKGIVGMTFLDQRVQVRCFCCVGVETGSGGLDAIVTKKSYTSPLKSPIRPCSRNHQTTNDNVGGARRDGARPVHEPRGRAAGRGGGRDALWEDEAAHAPRLQDVGAGERQEGGQGTS